MFTRIQTNGFKSLLSVDQRLTPFCALVGPNASGKTSFLECIWLLSDLMRNRGDILATIQNRAPDFLDLTWKGQRRNIQLALEADVPQKVSGLVDDERFRDAACVRYEIDIGLDDHDVLGINNEALWLLKKEFLKPAPCQRVFPNAQQVKTGSIMRPMSSAENQKILLRKTEAGQDGYYAERDKKIEPVFKFGRQSSTLASLPADAELFPVSLWFLEWLRQGVQYLVLDSRKIRQPSPPNQPRRFLPDGSNLPWIVADLREQGPEKFDWWLKHIKTALPDVDDITTFVQQEDRRCYLRVHYANGAVVPSWLVSDGTLRLLALTIPAYLPDMEATFLVEEPENGIHPNAVETVVQSLSSIYDGQVLMATHSPIVLNMVKTEDILCFAKDEQGATAVVTGDRHPRLQQWKRGNPDLGMLFASGVLG